MKRAKKTGVALVFATAAMQVIAHSSHILGHLAKDQYYLRNRYCTTVCLIRHITSHGSELANRDQYHIDVSLTQYHFLL